MGHRCRTTTKVFYGSMTSHEQCRQYLDKLIRLGWLRLTKEQQGITNYINVKSVQEHSSKVEQLGGKVIMQKTPVPGMVISLYA
jgi:hypothetical protein